MPEQEFESFLALLGKHLHLSTAQKATVSAELRDHLETRFNELVNSGVSREEAVRQTLDDVGDGKQLARELGSVRRIVQSRRLRRIVFAGAAIAASLLVVSRIMVPSLDVVDTGYVVRSQPAVPHRATEVSPMYGSGGGMGMMSGGDMEASMAFVQADAFGEGSGASPMASGGVRPGVVKVPLRSVPKTDGARRREELERRLDEMWEKSIAFESVPLKEAIGSIIGEEPVISLVYDRAVESSDLESPVSLTVGEGVVSLRTLLALILEQASSGNRLALMARDGVLFLTNEENAVTIEVYSVDDLLSRTYHASVNHHGDVHVGMAGMAVGGAETGMPPGMGMPGSRPPEGPRVVQVQGFGGGGGGGMMGMGTPQTVASDRGRLLVNAVREALVDAGKVMSGQPEPSISEVNGLLVVRATPSVHREVLDLLGKMRQALGEQERPADAGAGAGAPPAAAPASGLRAS